MKRKQLKEWEQIHTLFQKLTGTNHFPKTMKYEEAVFQARKEANTEFTIELWCEAVRIELIMIEEMEGERRHS